MSFEKYFKTALGFYLHSCGLTRPLEWLFNYVLKVAPSQPERFVPLNAALVLRGSSVQAETHHLKNYVDEATNSACFEVRELAV